MRILLHEIPKALGRIVQQKQIIPPPSADCRDAYGKMFSIQKRNKRLSANGGKYFVYHTGFGWIYAMRCYTS